MSGEAVLVPLIWTSFVGVAGAVEAAVEARQAAARQRAEAERERIRAWQEFQSRQNEDQAALSRSRQAVREARQQLMDAGLDEAVARESGGPAARGFVDQNEAGAREYAAAVMAHIDHQLAALPSALFDDERLPFARLRSQLQRMQQGAVPTVDEVNAFKSTLQRTYDDYVRRADQKAEQQQKLAADAERLLTQILEARELSIQAEDDEALAQLEQKLVALLAEHRVSPAVLDVISKRFGTVRENVQRAVTEDEMNDYLAGRVTHHLNEMGYATLSGFTEKRPDARRDAEFALPDGDRLRVALQPDLRIGFQLSHEARTMIEKTLSGDALAFFRQQEARWCRDMKELIRRLVKDGVPYEVQFERDVPDEAIPVVVMETVDELLDEEEEERRRRRDKRERHFT